MTTEALPPTLAANPRLGNWLRISSDGIVEIRSGKVELGQGVLTALAQVAAEELDVDVARIEMTAATTDLSPDEGLTAGSLSIQQSGAALRQVCAEVRDIYVEYRRRQTRRAQGRTHDRRRADLRCRTARPPATGSWPTTP